MASALPPPALDIREITLHRAGSTVLDHLSVEIAPGSLTALAGPPGSGKTALMRVLAGLAKPHAGSVAIDGEDISHTPARLRGFGVVLQPDRLFPHLSLAENVALPLRLRGIGRAARLAQARETLDLLEIESPPDALPRDCGPADLQRALLARAAVFAPSLMLLDEPFPSADAQSRVALAAGLARIHALLGATILLATRNLRDALPVCDRVILLRDGNLEQAGMPEEVFNRPSSAFAAGLCGETNRLPGKLREVEDDIATVQLACGPAVEARNVAELTADAPCLFVLRPEHIAVAPVPASEMGEGALDAILIDSQFWGDSYRLRLLIGSGAELVVRRPAIAGMRGLAPGRPCAVAWQSHYAMVFAASES